jgi:hypothetical protein
MKKQSKGLGDIDVNALEELASSFPATQAAKERSLQKKEKEVTLTLRIPASIAKDLRIKAATADKTQREIILEGLKLMGISISDEEISDRRKR